VLNNCPAGAVGKEQHHGHACQEARSERVVVIIVLALAGSVVLMIWNTVCLNESLKSTIAFRQDCMRADGSVVLIRDISTRQECA
jgi:hypothetical protein